MRLAIADSDLDAETDEEPTAGERARPKVLVIATVHWAATTRLCLAMADGGFEVKAIAPDDHAVHRMPAITGDRLGRSRAQVLETIVNAIETFRPDLVIPGDDPAIGHLRMLYERAMCGGGRDSWRMAELIEASLGAPSSFVFGHQKSQLIDLARAEGLLVPETTVIRDIHHFRRLIAKSRFPKVLKRDDSGGGDGVRIVADPAEAMRAFVDLQSSAGRLAAIKKTIKKLDPAYLDRFWRAAPVITLQQYVVGRPANRAVACWRGEALAGMSVEVVQTVNATGPATVVRVIDSPGMTAAVARLARRLGLSGFAGFDFMLEAASGRPYLIELNARPTQICHLALDPATDMIGALSARLSATGRRRMMSPISSPTIALFPQESWRDPDSEYLLSAHHDVPWQTPEFAVAYRHPVAPEPRSWVQVMRQRARRMAGFHERKAAPPTSTGRAAALGEAAKPIASIHASIL